MIEGSGKNELGPIKIIPQCIIILYLLMPYQSGIAQTTGHGYQPEQYTCYKATEKLNIDGLLDEADWGKAIPTKPFVDIEGEKRPLPWYETRVQMLWDEEYFYIAAELEEENIWATYSQHDAVIYQENNFEVFIDPDRDGHDYFEIEVNPLNTIFDLFLSAPYRDGGPVLTDWDLKGLKTAIKVFGSLNDPADRDSCWMVEMALPLSGLSRKGRLPQPGAVWKINFSRVEYEILVREGQYQKQRNAAGKPLPEHNWVWSPQGIINMHYPEKWGYLLFDRGAVRAEVPADDAVIQHLYVLYHYLREYREEHGRYPRSLENHYKVNAVNYDCSYLATDTAYLLTLRKSGSPTSWSIREDGRVKVVTP